MFIEMLTTDATMTAPLKSVDSTASVADLMQDIGRRARKAARVLAIGTGTTEGSRRCWRWLQAIRAHAREIIAANEADVADAKAAGHCRLVPRSPDPE